MRKLLVGVAALALVSGVGSAKALDINPQLFVTGETSSTLDNPPFTLGWEFEALSSITVNALGIYDVSGLLDSYPVGIWDSSGNLIAETTVDSGGTIVNQWIYDALATPVTLTAGDDYYVGALYTTSDDPLVFPGSGTVTTTSNISYITSVYAFGSSLSWPTSSVGFGGYFGPNISATTSTIPEPSTWAMMLLGFAGLGLAGYRQRHKFVRAASV
jgi:Domain of unknown function (DUF4082)/PEP-CTERM motif